MARTPKTPTPYELAISRPEFNGNANSNGSNPSNGHNAVSALTPSSMVDNGSNHGSTPSNLNGLNPLPLGMVSVAVILPPSFQGINRCELQLRDTLNLLDLKQTLSGSLHHFDALNPLHIFYHEASCLLFNDNTMTIRDCMNRVDALNGSNALSNGHPQSHSICLKIGILSVAPKAQHSQSINRSHTLPAAASSNKAPPPPVGKRRGYKPGSIKPLPPSGGLFVS